MSCHDHSSSESCHTGCKCKCPCHSATGILLTLIGIVFLLGNFDVVPGKVIAITWPILVILIGLNKSIKLGICKCCSCVSGSSTKK